MGDKGLIIQIGCLCLAVRYAGIWVDWCDSCVLLTGSRSQLCVHACKSVFDAFTESQLLNPVIPTSLYFQLFI